MQITRRRFALVVLSVLAAGCAPARLLKLDVSAGSARAEALWRASLEAHGGGSFSRIRDLSVRYAGQWSPVGPRLQPVLSDTGHRAGSEERLLLSGRLIAQSHAGPLGGKFVAASPAGTRVWYDSVPSEDPEVLGAAALVADAYRMFILGPHFFEREGVSWFEAPDSEVNGAATHSILAVLKPGIGPSPEDRVLLSIHKESHRLVRVLLSLNGFEPTRGAEVDVTFSDFRELDGIPWPTRFHERIRSPARLSAHRWSLEGLDINRGLEPGDILGGSFTGAAAAPAAGLPSIAP